MNGILMLTDIKETKKGRYALFCDGEFCFSVDEETLLRHHLAPGVSLTGEQLLTIRAASDYQRAKDRAFTYLSMRDHSEKELYTKLLRNFDPHTAAATAARLHELGLLDDAAFARKLAAEYVAKGKSRAELRCKFTEKGIGRELAEEVLADYDEDESDAVRALIQEKYFAKLQKPNGRASVYGALMRRGFRSADIRRALEELKPGEDEGSYYE